MSKNKKNYKKKTPQTGEVYVTSNYRLKKYNKKNSGNSRMTVLTKETKTDKQYVNAIVGKENKHKLTKGYIELDKNRNTFLKKKSVVSLEKHETINSTKGEIKRGRPPKRKTDVTDNTVFKKIGKIHWKDKKKIKKLWIRALY